MLAYPFEEKRLDRWVPPYIVQPKLDGERCRATPISTPKSPSHFMLLSSEENPFFSAPHIIEALDELRDIVGKVELDGELYSHYLHQEGGIELIHSIASRTVNLHPRYKELEYHIFDIAHENSIQASRLMRLVELEKYLKPPLRIVPYQIANNLDEVMRIYDKYIEEGYEGIIVRNVKAPYIRKRSIYMMKFKPKKTDIYKCIGWKEEKDIEGNPKGRLGSLILTSDEGSVFSVGSGLRDEDREELWETRDELLDRNVLVKYQHITSGNRVPRFPIFVKVL